jgi:tetratricopeptide (TPR) repeat protein
MRWIKILLIAVLIVGITAYTMRRHSPSNLAAASLVDHAFAPSWSSNEHVISSMEEHLKQDPNDPKVASTLGQAYLQRARESGDPAYYSKAELLFERALKRAPGSVDAMLGKASLLMARHEFHKAKEVAEKAIDANPDVVAAYGILTDALVELGDYDEAIRTLDIMVRRKPNLSSYSRVSYIRELIGDVPGAIQAMKMAVESGAPNAENTAWCMAQLGNLYLNDGQVNRAEEQYQQALIRFPNYAHATAGLAKVAAARGDLVSAAEHYKLAMDRIPLAEFAIGLGEVYERMGKDEDAKAQFDLVDAIQELYRSNGVSIDIELALFNADRGRNISRALDIARKEWNARKSVRVADAYAWVLYRAGRHEEAQEMMHQALRLGTRDPLFLRHAEVIFRAWPSATTR